ncbi:ribose-phosphate diphosphokinase [Allobaculum stercoricanis]|uniref:ribose-phosphate diphosphokinase n=1 Tax=Allobaculum stercoricanis TaxID=174709 RepID=UPI00248E31C9|nr:ribose-phosphate pyrophosphokinase [Allobaculum stercoricanis]
MKQKEELKDSTVVFALSASKGLAQEICDILDLPLGKCDVHHFADGEILVELGESVRGKDVFFVQSTNRPVNDNLMELLIGIDACMRASARSINCVIPYFGYARQDRKAKPRQPISSKLIATMLERAGANRVITMDLHAAQIQGYFDIPADDLNTLPLIAEYLKNKDGLDLEDIVVVSPDHGGTVRARRLADRLGAPVAIIDKRRPKPNVAVAMNLLGDVDGKVAVVIDDMVDTAGTLTSGINMLYEKGAKQVIAACAHGVLSGPAIDRLKSANLAEFIVTNTIDQAENKAKYEEMTVLSVAPLAAAAIEAIEENESLSTALNAAVSYTDQK